MIGVTQTSARTLPRILSHIKGWAIGSSALSSATEAVNASADGALLSKAQV
jgi:hypothetical protein